jgi:hypothetical protein
MNGRALCTLPAPAKPLPLDNAEAWHGVAGRPVGNAVPACAYNDATSLIFDDADHQKAWVPIEVSGAR